KRLACARSASSRSSQAMFSSSSSHSAMCSVNRRAMRSHHLRSRAGEQGADDEPGMIFFAEELAAELAARQAQHRRHGDLRDGRAQREVLGQLAFALLADHALDLLEQRHDLLAQDAGAELARIEQFAQGDLRDVGVLADEANVALGAALEALREFAL